MPSSPVKTRVPLSSFGHLVTEVQRQLFGIKAPVNLTGWRKHVNTYTLQGRRNFVLATYGVLALTAAACMLNRNKNKEHPTPSSPS
ncbi:ATP synthase membrane subunit K, mitochondrial-like [Salminus brasiliensis]|uniref:ATP synthase membrane subunit K, mitochondrial-like n=1 Tax=Salminus brasiliensis TaxID=930266 RepID=UPI003B831025